MPHENGIHVDMRKYPAVYTPLSLSFISTSYDTMSPKSLVGNARTYKPPTTLPAMSASMPPMMR